MFSTYVIIYLMYVQPVYCRCKQVVETIRIFHFPKVNMHTDLKSVNLNSLLKTSML